MYVSSEDIRDKIPISESVKKLEAAYPHLKNIKWNDREKKGEEEENVEVTE